MNANTRAEKHGSPGFHVDWERFHAWKGKCLSREKWAEITLIASTGAVLGYFVWWAAQAAQSYTILGLG